MSALPRPDLPPGPHRDIVDALHDLHHRAGWPSLRRLAAEHRRLPHHRLQGHLLARACHRGAPSSCCRGDGRRRRTASTSSGWRPPAPDARQPPGDRASPAARRARRRTPPPRDRHRSAPRHRRGRHRQDNARRDRHRRPANVCVAVGHCLPLSMEAPLMPVAGLLRAALESDDGGRLRRALAACPTYVAGEIAPTPARAGAGCRRVFPTSGPVSASSTRSSACSEHWP